MKKIIAFISSVLMLGASASASTITQQSFLGIKWKSEVGVLQISLSNDMPVSMSISAGSKKQFARVSDGGIVNIQGIIEGLKPTDKIYVACTTCSTPTTIVRSVKELNDLLFMGKKRMADEKREAEYIRVNGDGSPDDLTCKEYGIKPSSAAYLNCRLKLKELALQRQTFEHMVATQEKEEKERKKERNLRQSEMLSNMSDRLLNPPKSNSNSSSYSRSRDYECRPNYNGSALNCTAF